LPIATSQAEAGWDDFVGEVQRQAGIDLRPYKPDQIQRRVRGLMLRSGVEQLQDYLRLLVREPARRHELHRCMTVTVSEFFRSPDQFEHLAGTVLPRLLVRRRQLRIWSAGCAYGAEPYSIALLLQGLAPERRHYILATDIDELALARARAADSFTERDVRHVRPPHTDHFGPSPRADGHHALRPDVRSRVVFRRHNVLSGPPELDFDLVVCRNVMIYFTLEAKRQLFSNLHQALQPGGYLFVGDSEVMNELPEAGFSRQSVGFYRKEVEV